jgi:hypothetical protein
MSGESRLLPALRPIEGGLGVLVHTTADRRTAAAHWLLSAAQDQGKARADWRNRDVAMLRLGTLFSAVRIPAAVILAVTGGHRTPSDCIDNFLREVVDGPVVCDPRHLRYYALVPASMPTTWTQAAADWRALGIDMLGRESILGVPDVALTEAGVHELASYWSVPMDSAGELCSPLAVARLLAAAFRVLAPEVRGAQA